MKCVNRFEALSDGSISDDESVDVTALEGKVKAASESKPERRLRIIFQKARSPYQLWLGPKILAQTAP